MKRMASAEKNSKSKGFFRSKRASQFAVCIRNDEYPASLELRKIYELLADIAAERVGQVWVRDETGEGYLYPADYFLAIKLPTAVERAMFARTEYLTNPHPCEPVDPCNPWPAFGFRGITRT